MKKIIIISHERIPTEVFLMHLNREYPDWNIELFSYTDINSKSNIVELADAVVVGTNMSFLVPVLSKYTKKEVIVEKQNEMLHQPEQLALRVKSIIG